MSKIDHRALAAACHRGYWSEIYAAAGVAADHPEPRDLVAHRLAEALAEFYAEPDPWAEAGRKLDEYATLPVGWDSYGGLPTDPRAIETMRRFLRAIAAPPSVGPCGDGGAEACWLIEDLEIVVSVDSEGKIESFVGDVS